LMISVSFVNILIKACFAPVDEPDDPQEEQVRAGAGVRMPIMPQYILLITSLLLALYFPLSWQIKLNDFIQFPSSWQYLGRTVPVGGSK
ncbi:MAG: hypothetical protein HQK53_09405, partial [Oligoflexia bacterium]|nr:hypothetical protein [Oligoflexia bacterium]